MFEKNLKYYRLKNNMSKKDLASACGVTSMAISNYESGKRKPDMDIINKLASVLGIRVSDFLSSRNTGLSFDHREFRKNSTLTKAQQEFVRESVEEYFSRFFDAVDCLGGNPVSKALICHDLMHTGNIETDAQKLRENLSLQMEGPIDEVIGILENKGIMILELDVKDNHFYGMNGLVNEYPYIVINKNMRKERKRTTIIHELVHIKFHEPETSDQDAEKMATAIAGAFLIPRNDLFCELGNRKTAITKDMALVCRKYGISMYLLVKRAAQVGIISKSIEKLFYIQANQTNWKIKEPNRVMYHEEPQLFKRLVYRAINEEGVSRERGAELLGASVSEINKYCGRMEV